MKYCFIAIFAFFLLSTVICKTSEAKVQKYLDSIETSLEAMKEDSAKVQAYGKLFYQFEFTDSAKARDYITRSLALSKRLHYQEGLANTYMQFGFLNDDVGNYDEALLYYEKSLEVRFELKDQRGISIMQNNIGIIYKEQGRYPEALEQYHKALKIAESSDNKYTMGLAYNNIGILHDEQQNYEQSIIFYLKAVKIAEELDNKGGVAGAYTNLGVAHVQLQKYPEALDFYIKSIKIYEEAGVSDPGLASNYNNIGLLYHDYMELDLSPKERHIKSMDYYQKALSISEQIGDQEGIAVSLINMGNAFCTIKDYQTGIEFLDRSLLLSDKIGSPYRKKEAYEGLAQLYELQGNYLKALENYKLFTLYKDSLFNEEKSKDLGKLEAKHEFETAEAKRNRQKEEEKRNTAKEESRRNNLQYSGILIFLVLMFTGIFFLGRFSLPIRFAEGLIFFTFLLVFEFTLVLLDPFIETYSQGEPAYKLLFNAVLAGLIFPMHSFFEERLKSRIIS